MKSQTIDNLIYERQLNAKGLIRLAGVDEVGRGCLAGPVLTACVELPLNDIIEGVTDSKLLSPAKREKLYEQIISKATQYHIGIVSPQQIDKINILNATKLAMTSCIEQMQDIDCVLIDAVCLKATKFPTFSLVKGDLLSYLIASASIVAKVTRDRLMQELSAKYPFYDFASNKGYGTAKHITALKRYGFCEIHRKTFITHFTNV
ncbi:MAG: ribonuclease HII [Clostridia bacterium]